MHAHVVPLKTTVVGVGWDKCTLNMLTSIGVQKDIKEPLIAFIIHINIHKPYKPNADMMHTHLWQMYMDMHTRTHTEAQS